jgi:hypothetical protein
LRFDNVTFDAPGKIGVRAVHAEVSGFPLRITGDDVTVTGEPGSGGPNACTEKFVPFPLK